MDKAAPKSSEMFQANRGRAAPLLAKLRADGIGHMIGGEIVPSISGETFETKSPVDGTVLAPVARGGAEDIDLEINVERQIGNSRMAGDMIIPNQEWTWPDCDTAA